VAAATDGDGGSEQSSDDWEYTPMSEWGSLEERPD
jgi:hypothetical protein